MEACKLQIILHSARALDNVKNFGTMDPYVLVYTDRNGKKSEPCRTKVSKKGASSPVWECPMEFKVVTSMQNSYTLVFEIKHDGKLLDRDIGQVEVPFKDLLADDGFGDSISYPVKMSCGGEIKGEIVVSHKFMKQEEGSTVEKENGCPKEKVTKRKKKNGMMKRVAKNVAIQVATKAVLLGGMVGLTIAVDQSAGSNPTTLDENENEDAYVDDDEEEYDNEDDEDDEDDVEF